MTPQQKLEHLQDMQSFRALFIRNLARELASFIPTQTVQEIVVQAYAELLDKRLPSATEASYPKPAEQ